METTPVTQLQEWYYNSSMVGKHLKVENDYSNYLNLATWNLCLGLVNKKDYVSEMIKKKELDICCMQETDVPNSFDINLLKFSGYSIYLENNTSKSRCGIYVKNNVQHYRRNELEGENSGLIIFQIG